MKRRILKKKVNFICSELFAECIALSHYNLVSNPNDAENVMTSILTMHSDLISRLSHVEPGNVKGFFAKFRSDLRNGIETLTDQLQTLV